MYTHVNSFQFQLLAIDDEILLQTIVCLVWDSVCISITMDIHTNSKPNNPNTICHKNECLLYKQSYKYKATVSVPLLTKMY